MAGKYKTPLLALLCLLLATACADGFELGTKSFFDNPPPARMIYPTGETASLQGKQTLEFQWMDPIPINTGGFIFHLYKGYATTQQNLVLDQKLDRDATSVSVGADKFENGAVYTWTLRRVDDEGRKSDEVYDSFIVAK